MGMAVGRIQHQHIRAGLQQRAGPLQHIPGDADGGGTQQTALRVPGGVGIFYGLFNVLDGDQALQGKVFVHQRELLDLVGPQDLFRLCQRGVHRGGDQVFAGHDLAAGPGKILFKLQIPVGEDAHQTAVLADGDAGDPVFSHERVGVGQRMLR